jgi:hypothetical protein
MKKDAGGGGDDGIEGRRELGKDGVQRRRDETARCCFYRVRRATCSELCRISTPDSWIPRPRMAARAHGPADSAPHARVLGGQVSSEEAPRWIASVLPCA